MTDLQVSLPLIAVSLGAARVVNTADAASAWASFMREASNQFRDFNLLLLLADFLQHAAK
jgi:hypothetical protein